MKIDIQWMALALREAKHGAGNVHPNPMVGAVLVKKGRRIATGFHRMFGSDHAETDALKKAGDRARGSSLYVNLEPCSHWGKTPPCVDAIINAGVREVVAAMRDPNPLVAGRGFRALRRAGILVRTSVLEEEAQELNRAFVCYVTTRRPYVTVKAATSLDGKTATTGGDSKWITGKEARQAGHAFRAQVDAIAVGVHTILRDDPELSAHGQGRDPLRVVFDSELRTPPTARLLRSGTAIFFCSLGASPAKRRALMAQKAEVVVLARESEGISVVDSLRLLHERGIAHLLVEGGGTLAASFFSAKVVDEVLWFIAPKIIGGADTPTAVGGLGVATLSQAAQILNWNWATVGEDVCIRGRIKN